jgi:hypothetical protein
LGVAFYCAGQAEVQQLHLPIHTDDDIGWFQITMNDAAFMGGLEPLGDLQRDLEGVLDCDRTPFHPHRKILALGQLHDQETLTSGLLEAVDGSDVGVLERGQGPGFPFETGHAFGIIGILRATSRPSLLSVARYTSPMPPLPSWAVTS